MDGRAMALAGYSMKVWTLDSMLGSFAVTVIPVWYLLQEHADPQPDDCASPADLKDAASPSRAAVRPGKHGRTQARVSVQQPQQQASTCSAAHTPCSMQPCSMSMGDAMVTLVASPRKQAGGLKNADREGVGLSLAPHAPQQRLLSADGTPLQPRLALPELGGHSVGDSSEAQSPCSSQLAYADAASTVKSTPVPLVDRMQSVRSPMWLPRLPSLPGGTPLPASCPTTPPGQCRQPGHEAAMAPGTGRPLSANPESIRCALTEDVLSASLRAVPKGCYGGEDQ